MGEAIYKLRDRAVKEQISLAELARILLHLNQLRGYSSDRFAKEEKSKFDYYTGRVVAVSENPTQIDYEKNNSSKINWLHYSKELILDEPIKVDENTTITKFENARIFVKEASALTIKTRDIITFNYKEREKKEKGKIVANYYQIQPTNPDPDDWNYRYQHLQKDLTEWCSNGGTVG